MDVEDHSACAYTEHQQTPRNGRARLACFVRLTEEALDRRQVHEERLRSESETIVANSEESVRISTEGAVGRGAGLAKQSVQHAGGIENMSRAPATRGMRPV